MTPMAHKPMKRERDEGSTKVQSPVLLPLVSEETVTASTANATTNFRNVSACNRCRTRKNRCDQKLPRCTGCEKARVKCVGFDPVSKRTIPRSYVYYLETRVSKLEELLQARGIPFEPPESDFSISDAIQPGINVPFPVEDGDARPQESPHEISQLTIDPALATQPGTPRVNKSGGDAEAIPVRGGAEKRHGLPTAGISFAKVVFAAVRSTVSHTPSERGATKTSKQLASDNATGTNSARDSFFGLHTRPSISSAPFPEKEVGRRLVDLYFEYANPQIPILHRGEFTSLFERVYSMEARKRTSRELYLLNIVFAIGSGIIMDSSNAEQPEQSEGDADQPKKKRAKLAGHQHQPEEYHAGAVAHLESFLGSSPTAEGGGGGLEELQAVCLLAALALLRPVAPGLWYIIGVAVRLAVDLGLHSEDAGPEADESRRASKGTKSVGRKQWTKDLRRRLWWCVYSLDRLVSTCVGRPFGITDQVVTTEFPSMLDDQYITTDGFTEQPDQALPTYKLVAHHYFRLRLLQSEILQVLQHRQAEQARIRGINHGNSFINKTLISPFMGKFPSFQDWRMDVDRRLWEWKESAPRQQDIGVAFTPLFLELNYWQAVIMLYRQSLSVPEQLVNITDPSTDGDMQSPGTINERREDEEMVLMKVAQAGQTVLKLYRQLHRLKLVNYTYLATHHLFMSGISFLYAIWHSPLVRSQLTLDDVDFTVLIATSVLGDLIAKCPPAEACRDAFSRMAKATIAMVEKSTGFGTASTLASQPLNVPRSRYLTERDPNAPQQILKSSNQMAMPQFDMDLKALFSPEEIASRPLAQQFKVHTAAKRSQQAQAGALPAPAHPHTQQHHQQQASEYTVTGSNDLYQQKQSPTMLSTPLSAHRQPTQQFNPQYPISVSPTLSLSNQTPYQPLAQTISQSQPDFSFDTDMSFLDTFPVSDPSGQSGWGGGWNDFDMGLGFATGGTGTATWESDGDWSGMGGGVDMFDGFFFGGDLGNGNGSGSGGFG